MVICLERGADLHMAQLMPLPLTVSCFSKIQIGFTFLVPARLGSPGKRAVKRVCVCVCVCVCVSKSFNRRRGCGDGGVPSRTTSGDCLVVVWRGGRHRRSGPARAPTFRRKDRCHTDDFLSRDRVPYDATNGFHGPRHCRTNTIRYEMLF